MDLQVDVHTVLNQRRTAAEEGMKTLRDIEKLQGFLDNLQGTKDIHSVEIKFKKLELNHIDFTDVIGPATLAGLKADLADAIDRRREEVQKKL